MDPFTTLQMAFEQRNRTLSNSSNDDIDSIDRRKVARYREKVNVEYDNPCLTRTDDSPLLMMEENSCFETGQEDETEGEGRVEEDGWVIGGGNAVDADIGLNATDDEEHDEPEVFLYPSAPITVSDAYKEIKRFVLLTNLSQTHRRLLVKLLNKFLPTENKLHNKRLNKYLNRSGAFKYETGQLRTPDTVTEICNAGVSDTVVHVVKRNMPLILNWPHQVKTYLPCDITNSKIYKRDFKPNENHLTIMLHQDTIPVLSTKHTSFYVISGTLLEILPSLRDYAKNKLLLCIAHSCKDPDLNMLLEDLVKTLVSLKTNGLMVQYEAIYGQDNQLFSLHAVKYLPNQVDNHSALFASGCFADESSLGYLKKLRTSTRHIAYNIFSQYLMTHSIDEENNEALSVEDIFVKQKLDQSTLINRETLAKFTPHLKMSFEQRTNKTFSNLPGFARYRRGLMQFHSLIYQRLKTRISFVVSIKNDNCMYTKKCYASVILYFEYNNCDVCVCKNVPLWG
ncbi:unnamed protein product [Didymodactylos carnosus]|uniref:Uncharacterized protein n=2 Tax=Didymodactylos carnosus TaxID=1234261 RepID=A0A815VI03_9BILA|nr:unnamed protein product [Didymodactylos carnosus]CAF4389939.1 unnamed protein product [Didymodactylos carnosus]